jgi:hypothetical protein
MPEYHPIDDESLENVRRGIATMPAKFGATAAMTGSIIARLDDAEARLRSASPTGPGAQLSERLDLSKMERAWQAVFRANPRHPDAGKIVAVIDALRDAESALEELPGPLAGGTRQRMHDAIDFGPDVPLTALLAAPDPDGEPDFEKIAAEMPNLSPESITAVEEMLRETYRRLSPPPWEGGRSHSIRPTAPEDTPT